MAEKFISFSLTPKSKALHRRLGRAAKEIKDFKPMYKKLSIYLDRWVLTNFRTEGGNVGGWTPFKLGGRPVGGGVIDHSAKLLQDTGTLRASFHPRHSATNAWIFSALDYAEPHNEGLGHLPQRRMLPKRSEVIDDVLKIADKHVDKITSRVDRNV